MPDYNVYYCLLKPVTLLGGRGLTGDALTASPDRPTDAVLRGEILSEFETTLQQLFQLSVPHIPRVASRNYTVNVRRIPTSTNGMPNFSGLSIHIREPIVYLVTSQSDDCSATVPAARQRPVFRLVDALRNYPNDFTSRFLDDARDSVSTAQSGEQGHALMITPHAPQVAEVYSHVLTEASNWIEIMANMLAKTAFHEIAHCKAECTNRRVESVEANRRWLAALTHSIHNVAGVSVMTSPVGPGTGVNTADFTLMGQHMLCPMKFYKHGVDVDSQFFRNGQDHDLESRAEAAAAAPAPAPAPTPAPSGDLFDGVID